MYSEPLSALEAQDAEREARDLIDQIEVIQALDAVEIALMDGIDAHEAGAALGARLAALADGQLHRPGLVEGAALALIGLRGAQVVPVALGDAGQTREAGVAEERPRHGSSKWQSWAAMKP